MAFVYWITNNIEDDICSQGYVGVTSKSVATRIKSHKQSYVRFCNGGKAGCRKLYAIIKKLGGWDNVQVKTICESSTDYCLDLEYKLRAEPNVGWNTRVGGDHRVMFKRKFTEETKRKLALVRKTWVMSDKTRESMSRRRMSEGNPMFGTLPWKNPASTESSRNTWLAADRIYNYWVSHNFPGFLRTSNQFSDLNINSITTMVSKFKLGWIPTEDDNWKIYKESYAK